MEERNVRFFGELVEESPEIGACTAHGTASRDPLRLKDQVIHCMQLGPKKFESCARGDVHSLGWGCASSGGARGVEMPPVMRFSSPVSPTSPTLFNPHDEHQIVVAKAKGRYAIGYMDRVVC